MDSAQSRRRRRLQDILVNIASAQRIAGSFTQETFLRDETAQKAVCFDLLCISEATARLIDLDPTIATRHTNVPWPQVRAIGNVLRHEYASIDVAVVWETVANADLDVLATAVAAELHELDE